VVRLGPHGGYLPVTLHSPDMAKSEQVELLVDNGRLLERRVGEVLIEYMGGKPQEWWFSPREVMRKSTQ